MDFEKLKAADINIHVVATGAGAGIQQLLWETPGSSAYLSGASFPYSPEEQEELLGFMPEHFCSEEAAVDLASAAYMKAYKFGGKKPVGVGLTASVASEKEHRGDHRSFTCVISDDSINLLSYNLVKGSGVLKRLNDGQVCDNIACSVLLDNLGYILLDDSDISYRKADQLAKERFLLRPFFTANGHRLEGCTLNWNGHDVIMPGAFNPPHDGHFGIADKVWEQFNLNTIYQITTNPPHKGELTVQDCLKRAKLLQGRDRLFTRDDPFYIDKARAFPRVPMIIGADALDRMFDPKWGLDIEAMTSEFRKLGTHFYVSGREINGEWVRPNQVVRKLPNGLDLKWNGMITEVEGRWDMSSTEIRNKLK